jgi:signal transduction histidine kinase
LVKISTLVKHIFSSEKFDLDKVSLYTESVHISSFLHDEVYAFQRKFPGIDFIDNVGESSSRDIDETQFRQVIQNLINNAIKFIDPRHGKILVSMKQESQKICISIEDNGKGFDEIDISEVFEKYST